MWAHRANFTMKNKKAELSVKVRRVGGCSGGYRLQYLEILYLLSQRRSLLITLTNWLRVLRTAPFYHLTATFWYSEKFCRCERCKYWDELCCACRVCRRGMAPCVPAQLQLSDVRKFSVECGRVVWGAGHGSIISSSYHSSDNTNITSSTAGITIKPRVRSEGWPSHPAGRPAPAILQQPCQTMTTSARTTRTTLTTSSPTTCPPAAALLMTSSTISMMRISVTPVILTILILTTWLSPTLSIFQRPLDIRLVTATADSTSITRQWVMEAKTHQRQMTPVPCCSGMDLKEIFLYWKIFHEISQSSDCPNTFFLRDYQKYF